MCDKPPVSHYTPAGAVGSLAYSFPNTWTMKMVGKVAVNVTRDVRRRRGASSETPQLSIKHVLSNPFPILILASAPSACPEPGSPGLGPPEPCRRVEGHLRGAFRPPQNSRFHNPPFIIHHFTQIPHLRHSREEPAPYLIRGGNPSPARCTAIASEAVRHAARPN